MNQDVEKWPIFNQTTKSSTKSRSHESLQASGSLPYVLEGGAENSGMYTLRKKKKDKESQNNEALSQAVTTPDGRNDIARTLNGSVEAIS